MTFFVIVILVGTVRIFLITKDKIQEVDLADIDVIETDTNIDFSSYNLRIANSIKDTYGIDVYYGDSLNLESVNAVPITDDELPRQKPARPAAKFCRYCGSKLEDGDIYCVECGNKVQ